MALQVKLTVPFICMLAVVAPIGVAPVAVSAQMRVPVEGDRVRFLVVPARPDVWVYGQVAAVGDSALVVSVADAAEGSEPIGFSWDQVRDLSVSKGRTSNGGLGLAIGAVLGGAIGTIVGGTQLGVPFAIDCESDCGPGLESAAFGGVVFGTVGGLVGGAIGVRSYTEHWEPAVAPPVLAGPRSDGWLLAPPSPPRVPARPAVVVR